MFSTVCSLAISGLLFMVSVGFNAAARSVLLALNMTELFYILIMSIYAKLKIRKMNN